MSELFQIPELQALQSPRSLVRIPSETDVPVTDRVMRLIDTAAFRRLARISQLGLVSLVYPGATHTRFEHSMGAYRNALLYLQKLVTLEEFHRQVSTNDIHVFLVAVLFHDIGHFPFCHVIEDMLIPGMLRHEQLAAKFIHSPEIVDLLAKDWKVDASDVSELLAPADKRSPRFPLLSSLLSGPIDIDKLDYLDRDSLHAGVPYGRHFDRNRLISQLCLTEDGKSLAITDKARTAAEMMVFARYIMFSEVYWHHTVRSASAMLQRAIWGLKCPSNSGNHIQNSLAMFDSSGVPCEQLSEGEFIDSLRSVASSTPYTTLTEGLFGERRSIYKCIREYHCQEAPALHAAIARKPYVELVELAAALAKQISADTKLIIQPHELIIDAPPPKLEVQFNIQIRQSSGKYLSLGELSPVTQTLTTQQFDNLVKRVRVFVAPQLRTQLSKCPIEDYLNSILLAQSRA